MHFSQALLGPEIRPAGLGLDDNSYKVRFVKDSNQIILALLSGPKHAGLFIRGINLGSLSSRPRNLGLNELWKNALMTLLVEKSLCQEKFIGKLHSGKASW